MNMPDVPMQVEVNPNEDTEWNDILRKHGIIPEKPPSPTPMIEEALQEARRLAHENRLEGKDLDELAELEDDEDEDFLESYRQKRMAEMSQLTAKSKYNQVYPIQKPDWSREVTEESQNTFVFVLLTSSHGTNTESQILIEIWRSLAAKFGDLKFCQIRGDLAIEGYPDRNTPTILIYKDGDIKRQIVTLREMQGPRTTSQDLERLMVDLGALRINDPRRRREDESHSADEKPKTMSRSKFPTRDDDDSDSE